MKHTTYWTVWARAAVMRAAKTFAQAAIGMIAVGAAIYEIDWGYVSSVAAVAAVLSLLTSIAGLPEVGIEPPEEEDADTEDTDTDTEDEGDYDDEDDDYE